MKKTYIIGSLVLTLWALQSAGSWAQDASDHPKTHGKKKKAVIPPAEESYTAEEAWGKGNRALGAEDYATALKWFKKADQLEGTGGTGDGAAGVANMYQFGKGVPQDDAIAESWYQKAAEKDNHDAQLALGSKNKKLRRQAAGGDRDAQYILGMDCLTERKDEEGFRFIKASAEQGKAEAQDELGSLYFQGTGTAVDLEQAIAWESKAADQGYEGAQGHLDLYREQYAAAHPVEEPLRPRDKDRDTSSPDPGNASNNYDQLAADEAARKSQADSENAQNRRNAGMDP